ncbi:MAG: TlyA family RNA methyltransferase [Nitrospirae bacterium]|nr:TlyA family RNA methyltransferase [Nitrospirota bacterium]
MMRLDQLLVERGCATSREQARRLVMGGSVRVADRVIDKPGARVATDADVTVDGGPRYVSRGGVKLEGALAAFGLSVAGRVAMDVGASTGGFTDCLLQHGAGRVYAVDVGYGQLAWSLRQDPRVVVIERTNIRTMEPGATGAPGVVPERVGLVTADVSFISLRLVLPVLRAWLADAADLLVLVKPQFEVGRGQVGRGGVVRDPALRESALRQVAAAAVEAGYRVAASAPSVLPGPKGNQECFLWLQWESQAGGSQAGGVES